MQDFEEGELLIFNKPLYWTSFDLVKKVKNLIRAGTGLKKLKVGHAGTLDPLASGLMIICTGRYTKRINELQEHDKEYLATFHLGATTPSFDLETEVDARFDVSEVSEERVNNVLEELTGRQMQIPPVYSAKNIGGKRAYEYARKGVEVKMEPVPVVFHELEMTRFEMPEVMIRIKCSKGTYIRSFARDLGLKLGCGAYLSSLVRTESGPYTLSDSMPLEDFEKKLESLKQI
ncbi:MAG: tRNA pseudouridine(55) synthase TruB [Bacteroidales bacterium]|nr:tRNA pseudouridine(55) synthase TruB [Bacteroidales bacterium]